MTTTPESGSSGMSASPVASIDGETLAAMLTGAAEALRALALPPLTTTLARRLMEVETLRPFFPAVSEVPSTSSSPIVEQK